MEKSYQKVFSTLTSLNAMRLKLLMAFSFFLVVKLKLRRLLMNDKLINDAFYLIDKANISIIQQMRRLVKGDQFEKLKAQQSKLSKILDIMENL